jgi:hypothetical protein
MFEARLPTRSFRKFDSAEMVADKRKAHDTEVEHEGVEKKVAEIEHVA